MEMNKLERLAQIFDSFNSKADPVERWFLMETLQHWDRSWESLDSDLRCEQLHFPGAAMATLDTWDRLNLSARARIEGWRAHGRS